jgi:hypothetical protein
MKKLLPVLLFCFISYLNNAQTPVYRNSVQFHAEALFMKGDNQPQSPVLKNSLIYARKLGQSRWVAEGGISYTNRYVREQFTPFQSFFPGDRSQLITADLTFLYTVLSRNRHALRLGAGPSLWYTRNGRIDDLTGWTNAGGQQLEVITYTRSYSHSFNVALALRASYEYALTPRIIVGVRTSTGGNVLKGDGFSTLVGTLSTVGFSAGYCF